MGKCLFSSRISFAYNKELVLKNISLDISYGEYLGPIGPNGAGKTTLIRCLMGVLSPSFDAISIFGCNSQKERGEVFQQIGYHIEEAN